VSQSVTDSKRRFSALIGGMNDQIIFASINFAIVMTQQFAGFYAFRLLKQNGIIEQQHPFG
jgi:hypothetical protein